MKKLSPGKVIVGVRRLPLLACLETILCLEDQFPKTYPDRSHLEDQAKACRVCIWSSKHDQGDNGNRTPSPELRTLAEQHVAITVNGCPSLRLWPLELLTAFSLIVGKADILVSLLRCRE